MAVKGFRGAKRIDLQIEHRDPDTGRGIPGPIVEAWTYGEHFAIHARPDDVNAKEWCITHINTGRGVSHYIDRKRVLTTAAKCMESLPDMGFATQAEFDRLPYKAKRALIDIGRRARFYDVEAMKATVAGMMAELK